MCFCLCRLNQAVFLSRAKPWPNFPGIMQTCIWISMRDFNGYHIFLEISDFIPMHTITGTASYKIFIGS